MYISQYPNIIPADYCKHLIDKFEAESLKDIRKNDTMDFTEVNLNDAEWTEEIQTLGSVFTQAIDAYLKHYDIKLFPENYAWEQFRMKKYDADQGEFREHIDATNLESSKRFLVFFVYLNDGDGGGTTFTKNNLTIQRETGKLIMFPPLWTHPHKGDMPVGNPKYIIGSYLHFL